MKKLFLLLLILLPLILCACDLNTDTRTVKVRLVNWNPFSIYLRYDREKTVHQIYAEKQMTIEGYFFGEHTLYIYCAQNPEVKKMTIYVPYDAVVKEFDIFYNPDQEIYKIF